MCVLPQHMFVHKFKGISNNAGKLRAVWVYVDICECQLVWIRIHNFRSTRDEGN